jgi:hypothetical protein
MALDYRGYGASGGRPTEAGLWLDARAAYDWLRRRGVPPGRIVPHGHSLGAALAAWLAGEVPVAGVILEGAMPGTEEMGRYHYPFLLFPRALVRDRYATLEHLARVRCPVLVLHGEADAIVPLEFGRNVYAAAGLPKTFASVPNAGHNDLPLGAPEVSAGLSRFIADCMRGG